MKLRKIQSEDLKQVILLSNQVFKTSMPMEDAFPLLFHINNKHSYVIEEDNKIISFVGIVPVIFKDLIGVSIGSVCTHPDYQGQGILGTYFPSILKELKESMDFALISGAGKLYSNNGALEFGEFYEHTVRSLIEVNLSYRHYNGHIDDLKTIYNLIEKEKKSFDYGISELDILLDAEGYSGITNQKQRILIEDDKSAFVIVATKNKIGEVIDYAGNTKTVQNIIESFAYTESLNYVKWVSSKRISDFESTTINNQGTIIYFKNIDETLPYTKGLRFI